MVNKALLLILDGFGLSKETKGNAIKAAKTPHLDDFFSKNPFSTLKASGLEVGLQEGDMGNSEVGHLNIGAGRVVYQLSTLIDKKIQNGTFFNDEILLKAINHAKENKSKLHLFGLLSDGNVHSSIGHLTALLKICKKYELDKVYYHAFMDGRDTLPNDGYNFMKYFLEKSKEIGIGKIATISGRFYAMDRDNRWERIEKAYDAIVNGKGEFVVNPLAAIKENYSNNITDEFMIPKVIFENGKPIAKIEDNDSIIFFNFRADRARELTRSLIMPDFNEFKTNKISNLKYVTFNKYDEKFENFSEVAFCLPELNNILGEIIADKGLKQLRLAETEKYAHVTFFFNGGVELPFENEDRILVNSPKVHTYDLKPEMSAYEVTKKLKKALETEKYDLIITNFANCDMVGHTGIFSAAKQAVETVDKCFGDIFSVARKKNYSIFITADHGNADKMLDENGNVFTAHSLNEVPFSIETNVVKISELKNGKLADIAPTILKIMGIEIAWEMTGNCLVRSEKIVNNE